MGLCKPAADVQQEIIAFATTPLAVGRGVEPATTKARPFGRNSGGNLWELGFHDKRALNLHRFSKASEFREDSRNRISAISTRARRTAPDHSTEVIQRDISQMRRAQEQQAFKNRAHDLRDRPPSAVAPLGQQSSNAVRDSLRVISAEYFSYQTGIDDVLPLQPVEI